MRQTFGVSLLASILIASAQAALGDTADTILLGDSMLDFSGLSGEKNLIQVMCSGKKFKNRAIAGSKASQWATNTVCGDACCKDDIDDTGFCSVSDALTKKSVATGYKTGWLSLGGNDFMDNACAIEPLVGSYSKILNTLITDLRTIMAQTRVADANVKMLMTGYMIPISAPQATCTIDKMSYLQKAIKDACELERTVCTYIDVSKLAKGSDTQYSADAWNFKDPIHLNKFGFCTVMKLPAMQTYFGCAAPATPYDCYDYIWVYVVIGVVGAAALGVGIWQILVVTGAIETEVKAVEAAVTPKKEEGKKEDSELNKFDDNSLDFGDFHSASDSASMTPINDMRAQIPTSFNGPLQTAVEYVQLIGMLPYQNGAKPAHVAGLWQ